MSCGFDEVTAAVQAKEPVIVDVRTEDEFASGRIPGATNIPLSEVNSKKIVLIYLYPIENENFILKPGRKSFMKLKLGAKNIAVFG